MRARPDVLIRFRYLPGGLPRPVRLRKLLKYAGRTCGMQNLGTESITQGEPMSGFKKAVRQASKLRLGLIGPPGSGKTYTALLVATHLRAGRIAVIDTEHESSAKYAPPEGQPANPDEGTFEFDSLALSNFSPQEYVKAIKLAEAEGYAAIVIDSLSHAWVGTGGALEMHDAAVDRQRGSKNAYTAWREVTPHHLALVEAMLQSSAHVIATCRAKVEYVQEKDSNGKTSVRKVGMAAVQREGLEYEFDVTADLDTDNKLVVGKTRCRALRGHVVSCPGKPFADTLRGWLAIGGAAAGPEPKADHTANGSANGTAPPKVPQTGAQLQAKLDEMDAFLKDQGWAPGGALAEHMIEWAREHNYNPEPASWPVGSIGEAYRHAKEFIAGKKPSKAGKA